MAAIETKHLGSLIEKHTRDMTGKVGAITGTTSGTGHVCARELAKLGARVPQGRLDRHDETVAALTVPLDHSTVLDVTVMRGQVGSISDYGEGLCVERGVMHGALGLIPVQEGETRHVDNEGGPHAPTHPKVLASF